MNSDSLQRKHKPEHTLKMELIVTYQGKEVFHTYVKEALLPLCADLEQFYLEHMTERLLLQDPQKVFSTFQGEFKSSTAAVCNSDTLFLPGRSGSAIMKVLSCCLLKSDTMEMLSS